MNGQGTVSAGGIVRPTPRRLGIETAFFVTVGHAALAATLCLAFPTGAKARDSAVPLQGPEDAALLALRGQPARARKILGHRTADQADLAPLVVLASVALDEGNLEEAGQLIARLRSSHPKAVDGRVLEALVAERSAHPKRDWTSAGLAAAKAVQPRGEGASVFAHLWEELWNRGYPLPEQSLRRLTDEDAFLVRWAWPQPAVAKPDPSLMHAAMRLATSSDSLLVQMAAHQLLSRFSATQVTTEAEAAYQKVHGRLAQIGVLALMDLESGNENSPVGEEDVAVIEAAVDRARLPSFASFYSDLLRILEKVDPAAAPGVALSGAVTFYGPGSYSHPKLGARLKLNSSMSAEARQRLARALVRLADLQQREGTLLADMLAMVSLVQASDLLPGDTALKSRAEGWRAEALGRLNASRCLPPLLALPIRSLHRAWAREVANERRLFERARHLGLSCPGNESQRQPSVDTADDQRR